MLIFYIFLFSIQKALVKAFGANWHDQLLEFDMKPFAAASIGQVHRGVLKDRRPVAIKIQVWVFHQSISLLEFPATYIYF